MPECGRRRIQKRLARPASRNERLRWVFDKDLNALKLSGIAPDGSAIFILAVVQHDPRQFRVNTFKHGRLAARTTDLRIRTKFLDRSFLLCAPLACSSDVLWVKGLRTPDNDPFEMPFV